jgi:uncharacterized protein (UPF0335 family)
MARGRKPKQTTEDAAKPGHNGFDPQTVNSFVARVENRHEELLSERSKYMLACKGVREEIKEILDEAKDAGIPKRALRSVIKVRDLEAKAEKVREELEAEDQESHDQIRLALGDLADLPLGQAVLHPDTSERPFGAPPQ